MKVKVTLQIKSSMRSTRTLKYLDAEIIKQFEQPKSDYRILT